MGLESARGFPEARSGPTSERAQHRALSDTGEAGELSGGDLQSGAADEDQPVAMEISNTSEAQRKGIAEIQELHNK